MTTQTFDRSHKILFPQKKELRVNPAALTIKSRMFAFNF